MEEIGQILNIEVRDTGMGIPADQVKMIFDEFFQVGVAPNSSRNGYGLGLSIVKRISRLLDFEVRVASAPGVGTVFRFELPAAAHIDASAGQIASHRKPLSAPAGGGHRILLVEDEPGVRKAMQALLKMEGFHVAAAATADEAIARMREDSDIDLLITDFHLEPGRTGTEVIEAGRELAGAALRAILVTGDTSSAVRELQCDKNLRITSKPVNSGELLGLVKALLEI